jgi:CubicO group peptidase (beta-lactamase class C family)
MRDGEGMGMTTFSFDGKTLYGETGGSGSTGAWLAYFPEEKLALAYTTNAKIYPVSNIVSGAFDIYWNRPFEIPNLDALALSPDILDRYVGAYVIAGTPTRVTFSRDGQTLFFQPPEIPPFPSKRRQRTNSKSILSLFSNSTWRKARSRSIVPARREFLLKKNRRYGLAAQDRIARPPNR